MLKKLDFDYYFKESFKTEKEDDMHRLSATGLITPNQNIEVINIPGSDAKYNFLNGYGTHMDTLNEIFSSLFDIDIQNLAFIFEKDEKIKEYIKYREDNYVFIRYIHFDGDKSYVMVNIPRYITNYQYDELRRLYEIYKTYNVEVNAIVTDFNPVNQDVEGQESNFFEDDDALNTALNFVKNNNRILDYQLPYKEKILNKSKIK